MLGWQLPSIHLVRCISLFSIRQHQPFDLYFRWRKEDLLQDCVSLELGITEIPCEAGLFEVHDVFSTSGRRANEYHPPKNGGAVERHLLRRPRRQVRNREHRRF